MRFPILLFALPIAWPVAAQSSGPTAPVPVAPPSDAAPIAPAPKYDGGAISASAEGYIAYSGNHPASGAKRFFDSGSTPTARMDMNTLTLGVIVSAGPFR